VNRVASVATNPVGSSVTLFPTQVVVGSSQHTKKRNTIWWKSCCCSNYYPAGHAQVMAFRIRGLSLYCGIGTLSDVPKEM